MYLFLTRYMPPDSIRPTVECVTPYWKLCGGKAISMFNFVAFRIEILRRGSNGHFEPIFTLTVSTSM